MATTVSGLIAENSFLIGSLMLNFILIFLIMRLSTVLGPFMRQSISVAFNRMKDPNLFIHFLNSKSAILEWRSYNQVVKLDPEDPTSELVYVDRANGFTPMAPVKQKKGFFSFLGKKNDEEKLNEIYTDDFVPIKIGPSKNYWTFGKQLHVIYEGQNITQNPLSNFSQDAQVKKAGIAVEHQLIANKLLAESEIRNKIATKEDVRNWSLLNLVLLGLGIVAVIVMVMGIQSNVEGFVKFVNESFESYKPALDNFIQNIPKVIVNEGN